MDYHNLDPKTLPSIPFQSEVIKQHRSALDRLVHEAVLIRKGGNSLLNLKEEYSGSTLPTLRVEGFKKKSEVSNTNSTTGERGEPEKDTCQAD